jgi:branched-chain amino acid transport system permease protein
MNIYLLQIINGVGIGMLYFLLAVGLSIVFGLLRFVNFAHGAFFLLGAYLCYQATAGAGFWWSLLSRRWPWARSPGWWSASCCAMCMPCRTVPHPLHGRPGPGDAGSRDLGLGPLGDNVSPPDLLQGVVMWGGFVYPKYRLFVIGFTAVLALLLWWVLEGTRLGSIVRAGSESTEMVSLLGLNISASSAWCSRWARPPPGWPARWPRRSAAPIPSWGSRRSASPSWWWWSAGWAASGARWSAASWSASCKA